MTELPRCASCKHWDRAPLTEGWRNAISVDLPYPERDELARLVTLRFGECTAIREGWDVPAAEVHDIKAVAWDGSEYRASVNTRDDFGCVLHESRPDDLGEKP